jgi:hypothetical protein
MMFQRNNCWILVIDFTILDIFLIFNLEYRRNDNRFYERSEDSECRSRLPQLPYFNTSVHHLIAMVLQ